jgi:GNAT superfamily N-acetyltransferase
MLRIRPAIADDAPLLLAMIRELAEFERVPEKVKIGVEDLVRDGFGENPRFHALIAEWNDNPAGYAVFYDHYSTYAGPAVYLEDVFVREPFRGRGIGIALMAAVAKVAVDDKRPGLHWHVLDWNEKAIGLYKALGAEFCDWWRPVMLSGDALARLSKKALE